MPRAMKGNRADRADGTGIFGGCFGWEPFQAGNQADCNKKLRKWKKWDNLQLSKEQKWAFVNKITE